LRHRRKHEADRDESRQHTEHMRDHAASEEPQPARGNVVHAEHRENQHAGQHVELHRHDPETPEHRIDHQIQAFAAKRHFTGKRRTPRDMRPGETMKHEKRPQHEAAML